MGDDNEGVRQSLVDRKFLHSNSTSHEWIFGAIAELIDNAYDPDVSATQLWIDIEKINGETCLSFTDNGAGMNQEKLHLMLSFGFSEKTTAFPKHQPIGRYGNGFKSGSMRLGKDAIVFTRNSETMSVGLLSQTYLEQIDAKTVLVPIVTWSGLKSTVIYPDTDSKKSLQVILQYSLFRTEKDLLDQLERIPSRRDKQQGTRIIIYTLAREKAGNFELDFESDPDDIRIQRSYFESHNVDKTENKISQYKMSLTKYVEILYLKPKLQIFIRGKKVNSIYINKILSHRKVSKWTPKGESPVKIEFGQNQNQDEYGIMMYHNNRLIKAFRKFNFKKVDVEEEMDTNKFRELYEQVIGVVELDFIEPNHKKQGFKDNTLFRNAEMQLSQRLWGYCVDSYDNFVKYMDSQEAAKQREKDTWVQCDNPECQKWRRLPYGTNPDLLPTKWYCSLNPDEGRNFCGADEEPEKDVEIQKPTPKRGKKRSSVTQEQTPLASASTSALPSAANHPPSTPDPSAAHPVADRNGEPSTSSPARNPTRLFDEASPEMRSFLNNLSMTSIIRPPPPKISRRPQNKDTSSSSSPSPSKRFRANGTNGTSGVVITIDDDDDEGDESNVSDGWRSHNVKEEPADIEILEEESPANFKSERISPELSGGPSVLCNGNSSSVSLPTSLEGRLLLQEKMRNLQEKCDRLQKENNEAVAEKCQMELEMYKLRSEAAAAADVRVNFDQLQRLAVQLMESLPDGYTFTDVPTLLRDFTAVINHLRA